MFILNFKVNGSKIFKYFFIGVIILLVLILGIVIYRVFSGADNSQIESDTCMPKNSISKISPKNYTNILKAVHEDIDSYVGQKISFSGYVYRVLDLQENQFILARDMIINSNFQTVIVGFLCEYDDAKKFDNNVWVNITGEIVKGDYHGDMPIVKIMKIEMVEKPSQEEYVYPPDDSYIPTMRQMGQSMFVSLF